MCDATNKNSAKEEYWMANPEKVLLLERISHIFIQFLFDEEERRYAGAPFFFHPTLGILFFPGEIIAAKEPPYFAEVWVLKVEAKEFNDPRLHISTKVKERAKRHAQKLTGEPQDPKVMYTMDLPEVAAIPIGDFNLCSRNPKDFQAYVERKLKVHQVN